MQQGSVSTSRGATFSRRREVIISVGFNEPLAPSWRKWKHALISIYFFSFVMHNQLIACQIWRVGGDTSHLEWVGGGLFSSGDRKTCRECCFKTLCLSWDWNEGVMAPGVKSHGWNQDRTASPPLRRGDQVQLVQRKREGIGHGKQTRLTGLLQIVFLIFLRHDRDYFVNVNLHDTPSQLKEQIMRGVLSLTTLNVMFIRFIWTPCLKLVSVEMISKQMLC